jgi:hypothetical protein
MIEFFRILFFSKVLLLTPQPVELFGEIEIRPKEPLVAITRGATIEIDVSSMVKKSGDDGVLELDRRVKEQFPAAAIEALLIAKDEQISLQYEGHFAYSKGKVMLLLETDSGVPVNVEFEKVILTSRIRLESAKVWWRNYKH